MVIPKRSPGGTKNNPGRVSSHTTHRFVREAGTLSGWPTQSRSEKRRGRKTGKQIKTGRRDVGDIPW
jgi:hypothetical protein